MGGGGVKSIGVLPVDVFKFDMWRPWIAVGVVLALEHVNVFPVALLWHGIFLPFPHISLIFAPSD